MNGQADSKKYIHINRGLAAIELELPANLSQYAEELRELIQQEFAFNLMDHSLEDRIQAFIEDFLARKENPGQ